MKKLRLAAIAAVMFFSASAFTKAVHTAKTDSQVWHLKDGQSDASNPANYEPSSGSESCGGNSQICDITDVASSNPDQPALSFGDPSSNPSQYSATLRDQP